MPLDIVKQVEGSLFIRIKSHDQAFIRLVFSGAFELPKRTKFSMLGTPSWTKLLEIRNDASFDRIGAGPVSDEATLFGSGPKVSKRKKPLPRMSASQVQLARSTNEIVQLHVPGCAGNPDFDVAVIKPAHPAEDLWLHFDDIAVQHVIDFLRSDLTLAALCTRRGYGQEEKGTWRNGSAGLVQKIQGADDEQPADGFETPVKRWRTVKGNSEFPEVDALQDRQQMDVEVVDAADGSSELEGVAHSVDVKPHEAVPIQAGFDIDN